jgi:hypothetical protein
VSGDGWRPLHEYLAQPALLLGGGPEISGHPPDAELLNELRRALKAGGIRNQVDHGGRYLQPRDGLVRGQIVGDLWNSVNHQSGELEGRPIKICEEDVRAHFRAWWRQRRSPEPEVSADLPMPAPAAGQPRETTEKLGKAPDASIRRALRRVYQAQASDPPNIKRVAAPVQTQLTEWKLEASGRHIMAIAGEDEFKRLRRGTGVTRRAAGFPDAGKQR